MVVGQVRVAAMGVDSLLLGAGALGHFVVGCRLRSVWVEIGIATVRMHMRWGRHFSMIAIDRRAGVDVHGSLRLSRVKIRVAFMHGLLIVIETWLLDITGVLINRAFRRTARRWRFFMDHRALSNWCEMQSRSALNKRLARKHSSLFRRGGGLGCSGTLNLKHHLLSCGSEISRI